MSFTRDKKNGAMDLSIVLVGVVDPRSKFFNFFVTDLEPTPAMAPQDLGGETAKWSIVSEQVTEWLYLPRSYGVNECVAQLKQKGAARADKQMDGFVNYGGEEMLSVMVVMCYWIWGDECSPKKWREDGVVEKLLKNGDMADPRNYGGVMLLSTVGKAFCKILNSGVVTNAGEGRKRQRRVSRLQTKP